VIEKNTSWRSYLKVLPQLQPFYQRSGSVKRLQVNEYPIIGGRFFEIAENNPMLGFRRASRYYNERYREAFALNALP
jgi:phosphoenolpyruvate synthase/pyruvate phosphate dikinase